MLSTLSYCWRVPATGLCFVLFGAGGLLLRVAVFPLLALCVRTPQRRVAAARAVIRLTFRTFVGTMRLLGVLRYEITGGELLERRGLLILANHPTLIDTVFLMALVEHADCIVKGDLWRNPFTRGPVTAAGYVRNDGGPELIDACIASLKQGNNLIVFPEGTRTAGGGALAFKRGASNIAVRGTRNVTPVLIRCEPPTLGKGEKWWHVPPRRAHFHIEVREDIEIGRIVAGSASEVLAVRRLTDHLQNYFTEETLRHA